MLTSKDIDKIIAVVATKEDVRQLNERVDKLERTQQQILSAIDRLATAIEKQNLQVAAMAMQLDRHEKWIRQIAKQAGVKLSD
ncbi:hypothetical protein HY969_00150 [Candidatus Kaiserbacteria bacterium]|nr:hypothetical protein [Candidatus Kaiserbacteria bacterium]